ncbi:hypothetical protein [Domibacillus tundrae]|uniref:hypothetical protein n=1 Tax=Domibacillus tundrae TaxID=1587527 RepID=UPI000617C2BA|nr:hypothetical protein [Domibacillus tundrae]
MSSTFEGRMAIISKYPKLIPKENAGGRTSVYYRGVAIIQQFRRSGSGYVPGNHIKTYTSEFDLDFDTRDMIAFRSYDDIRFERLIQTAMEVVDRRSKRISLE